MFVPRQPPRRPGFSTEERWSQGIDTRVRGFLDGFGGIVLTGKLEAILVGLIWNSGNQEAGGGRRIHEFLSSKSLRARHRGEIQ